MTPPTPTTAKRLLIFQKTKDPTNTYGTTFKLVNVSGLPISGPIPPMSSMLELPLRLLKALTDLLGLVRFKGWALLGAAPYNDISEEGKFFAAIVEQIREPVPERK
ncbi:hypothetical protein C8Q69DRAFT_508907 [Paecilomyces variotii]|uniref:Uncharacterized protein n=1 Tax=Byssochlamys spectabilis TaxID=264951 RepID=A0A443HPH3_BYSSP|nr:hypothetical protein C8Q69DRAFT_508907 [Paecilomyces variotii]RWQ93679.1 hypothetical protein C8Q69DRAFT_508907 [Paecilomyces variotii]